MSRDEVVRALGELTKVLRDTNRVLKDIAKISETVNRNIVEIERRRLGEVGIEGLEYLKPEPSETERLYNVCSKCMTDNCTVGQTFSQNCACCRDNHGVSPGSKNLVSAAGSAVSEGIIEGIRQGEASESSGKLAESVAPKNADLNSTADGPVQ